jgi:DNA-binding NarL/FixJ family response regulator
VTTVIVIAEAAGLYRTGAAAILESDAAFEVLQAGDRISLDEPVARRVPELALVAVDLPPDGGFAVLDALVERQTRVVMWGSSPSASTVVEAIRRGACGFLEKNIHPAALVGALHSVARGESAVSRSLMNRLVAGIQAVERRQHLLQRTAVLSTRERDVLALVAQGLGNRQIAAELSISEFTVKRHVHNILDKLGRRSRADAAALFVDAEAAAAPLEPLTA